MFDSWFEAGDSCRNHFGQRKVLFDMFVRHAAVKTCLVFIV